MHTQPTTPDNTALLQTQDPESSLEELRKQINELYDFCKPGGSA